MSGLIVIYFSAALCVMMRHLLNSKDFESVPEKALLKTLDPYQDLIITRRGVVNSSQYLMVSGVEIISSYMFSSSNFGYHTLWRSHGHNSLV